MKYLLLVLLLLLQLILLFQVFVTVSAVIACAKAGIIDGGHGYGGYAAAPVAYAAPVAKSVDYYVS